MVVDEWGMLSKDKEEPIDNLISWVFDEGTFKPAAKIVDGEQFSIITDYLGTPVEMYDSQGSRTWAVEYDIYGKIRKQIEGDVGDCPFRYQGQYEDLETGLYYNRFRYYSADEGVYLSQDPIRLDGNNPTLYGYTSDTNKKVDVFGLSDCSVSKKKPIIVGENMDRVKDYADKVGGHAYNPWKNDDPFDFDLGMKRNKRWIEDQIKAGREIIDIGPDFQRRIVKGYNSAFYEMERTALKNYKKLAKVFERTGNTGGVPGLDF